MTETNVDNSDSFDQDLVRNGGITLAMHDGTYHMIVEHAGALAYYTSRGSNWSNPTSISTGSLVALHPRLTVAGYFDVDVRLRLLFASRIGDATRYYSLYKSLPNGTWSSPVPIGTNKAIENRNTHSKAAHFAVNSSGITDRAVAVLPSDNGIGGNVRCAWAWQSSSDSYHYQDNLLPRERNPIEASGFAGVVDMSHNVLVRASTGTGDTMIYLSKPREGGTIWSRRAFTIGENIRDFALAQNKRNTSRIEIICKIGYRSNDLYHVSVDAQNLAEISRQRITQENFSDVSLTQSRNHLKAVGTVGGGSYSHYAMNLNSYQWSPGWVYDEALSSE